MTYNEISREAYQMFGKWLAENPEPQESEVEEKVCDLATECVPDAHELGAISVYLELLCNEEWLLTATTNEEITGQPSICELAYQIIFESIVAELSDQRQEYLSESGT